MMPLLRLRSLGHQLTHEEVIGALFDGDMGQIVKWLVIGALAFVSIIIVIFVLIAYPIVVIAIIGMIVAVLLKAAGFPSKYALIAFIAVLLLGLVVH